MNLIFIWLVGYLFTIGFYRMTKKEEDDTLFIAIVILMFFLWPLALGDELRKALS